MAKKDRFPGGCATGFTTNCELEGSGSSGRMDRDNTASEPSSAPRRKWINLNSASQDGFNVPIQHIPLSKLTPSERKRLVLRLRSELERIKLLQKRVESQRVNSLPISSSIQKHSYSNAQRAPSEGNIRRSSDARSAPGKKTSASVHKAHNLNRGSTGRFQSNSLATVNGANAALFKQCESLLKRLMSHDYGWVFNKPVDIVKLNIPDYFTIIKCPMDLGTIKTKLASGKYSSPLDFLADVRLTFSNAMTYNPPGNDAHIMAHTLSKIFEERWKLIEKKIPVTSSRSLSENSELHDEIEIVDSVAPAKKRKLSPTKQEVVGRKFSPVPESMAEPIKQKMTAEDKANLKRDIEASIGYGLPDSFVDFLRKHCSDGGESGEDELEIDFDALSDDVLFSIRKRLDEVMVRGMSNNSKAEACEIELPNEPGLSNSPVQLDKELEGNCDVDEDIDVGGNEPLVSIYPPVEIEKDTNNICNKESDSESYDDSDSSSSSESEASTPRKNDVDMVGDFDEKPIEDTAHRDQTASIVAKTEQNTVMPVTAETEAQQGNDSVNEGEVSPEKLSRAAFLKNRYLDTIIKAREKTLGEVEKTSPEKVRREKEELELLKKKEKARLQAEAKAAEDARRRAEAEAVAEAKRKREVEREAARQALLKVEQTVEINDNSRFLEDLEMLSTSGALEQQLPSSVDETSPDHSQDGLGSFKFGSSNPLEQLGLYMKADEEEDAEPTENLEARVVNDVEEGEID